MSGGGGGAIVGGNPPQGGTGLGGGGGAIQGIHHTHGPNKLPDFGWLEVYSAIAADSLRLRARFGDGDKNGWIRVSGGGGGWQSSARPKKRALTVWRGPTDALQYDIPLIFDGFADQTSVEDDLTILKKMVGLNQPGDPKPPLLILNANGALDEDVFNNPGNRWVIPNTPDYGEAIRSRVDGQRHRQEVTVSFMLYTTDDQLSRAKQVSKAKFVVARRGDTYNKIAARSLKEWGGLRWGNRLAQLNDARDGASKPLVGQLVRLPTVKQIEDWKRTPRR